MPRTGSLSSSTETDEPTSQVLPSVSLVRSLTGYQHPLTIYNLAFCATLGGALFGYDTGIINGANLLIKREFNLSDKWIENIVSATVGAAAVFSLFAGLMSDAIGRKTSIMLSAVVFTVGGVLTGVANGPYMLLAGRIAVGTAIGVVSTVVPVYVSECSPANIRGAMITQYQLFITFGIWLSSLMAMAFHDVGSGWRYMMGLSAIIGILQFLFFLGLPESPRYQVMQKDFEGARTTLEWIRDSSDVKDELTDIIDTFENEPQVKGLAVIGQILITPHVRKMLFIGCMLHMFQQFSGINVVIYYSSNILKGVGFDDQHAIELSVIPFTVNFLATFIGIWAVEAFGRKRSLALSFMSISVALLVLLTAFLPEYIYPDMTDSKYEVAYNVTGHCSKIEDCWHCIKDSSCGFCGLKKSSTNIINSSCVPSSVDGNDLFASKGRCSRVLKTNRFRGGDQQFYSFGHCPVDYTWVAVGGLMLFVLGFAPGAGPMPWTINAEIYPLWSRSIANSLATLTNWACNFMVSDMFLTATKALSIWGLFLIFSIVCTLGALFTMWIVPETKNHTLEDIGRGQWEQSGVPPAETLTSQSLAEEDEIELPETPDIYSTRTYALNGVMSSSIL